MPSTTPSITMSIPTVISRPSVLCAVPAPPAVAAAEAAAGSPPSRRDRMERLFGGSVAEAVVRGAACPVWVGHLPA